MANKIAIINGAHVVVPLTPEEEADAAARTAAEQSQQAIAAEAEAQATVKAKLVEIDLASIRGLREYIVAQPDAPKIIKDREAEAVAERAKLAPRAL